MLHACSRGYCHQVDEKGKPLPCKQNFPRLRVGYVDESTEMERCGKGTIYSLRLRDSRDSQDSGTPEIPKTPGFPRLRDSQDSRKTDGKSESDQSQVSQLSKPFSSSDSSLKMSAEGFCLLHKRMIHTNHGELLRIFDTYCRVWKAGGQATLTTSTEGGLLKANLDIQLGWPSAACPGAPPPHLVRPTAWSSSPSSTSAPGHSGARSCLQRRGRRHRGPAAKARSNARAAAYQVSLAAGKVGTASAPCPPPPPPYHHQLCQHGWSSLWKEKPVFGPPSASLMARAAAWKASTKVRSDMAMHHHHPPPHHYHPQLQRFEHRSFAWSALGAGTPGRPSSPTMQVHADVTRTSALTTPGGEQIWRDVFAPPRITQSVKVTYVCIAQCFSLARLHHWSHISQELEVLDHHHKIALKCFLRL